MKLIHLSDLHLGKRLNEFSLIEDQKYILKEILRIICEERPNAVIIAGDIYDKAVPSSEAVALFDDFLWRAAAGGTRVIVISGNHDSPERIAFGSRLMDYAGVYLSPVYDGTIEPIEIEDKYGTVAFYMLPFVKPINVRRFFPDIQISDYTDAVRCALEAIEINPDVRNVLITHQFVTGAERSDSEDIPVGGIDNVDASVFDGFDYVALGHLHAPQFVGRETVRYCGTPLKYSFSEKDHIKSVTVVELEEKGRVSVRTVPLEPAHDMREIRGTYDQLTLKSSYECTATEDYLHVILTDEEDVPDALARLRTIYPNIMKLDYDNKRTRNTANADLPDVSRFKSEDALFADFFEKQNGRSMSERQAAYSAELFEKIKEASL